MQNGPNTIDPRAAKEIATMENVLLLGLFHCGFLYARVNKPRKRGDTNCLRVGAVLFFLMLNIFTVALQARAHADEEPEEVKPAEIRMLDAQGRVLLSREKMPMAVAQIRPLTSDDSAIPVLSLSEAKAALSAGDPRHQPIKSGGEQVRELHYPLPTGNKEDNVGVLVRAHKVADGARILLLSNVSGPTHDEQAPGEHLPSPAPLELAVQIFADASGKLPNNFFVDEIHEALPLSDPKIETTFKRRARVWSFEIRGDSQIAAPKPKIVPKGKEKVKEKEKENAPGASFRVDLARSGPALWRVKRTEDFILLRATLLPDPRESGAFGSFVFYFGSGPDTAPPEMSPVVLNKPLTPARDFAEGVLRVYASGANPYSLSDVAVVAEVAMPPKPNGEVPIKRLPCFFWEAPSSAPAEGEFRFRFAPPTEDLYGVRVVVVTPTGQSHSDALALRAGPQASRGAARVRAGERLLRLDDGSPFIPTGIDLPGGTGNPGTFVETCRADFRELARHGGTAARLVLSLDTLLLDKQPREDFDADIASQLDEIFLAAQVRDIHLILCVENAADLTSNSTRHPYFRESGGPLAATPEFFRDVHAKKLFHNRLTYVAARYGAYRSVLAWDLMDNIEDCWAALRQDPDNLHLKGGEADLSRRARRDVEEWVEEMALHLKGMDQHEHPVCISSTASLDKPWNGLERLEHLDWVLHAPDVQKNGSHENDDAFLAGLAGWVSASRGPGKPHKPFMLGRVEPAPRPRSHEAEVNDAKTDSNVDSLSHNAVFASLVSGMGMAPLLNISRPSEIKQTGIFEAAPLIASALERIAKLEGKEELLSVAENHPPLRILRRSGHRGIIAWIQNKNESETNKEVELKLPGLNEGDYMVVWLDTFSGNIMREERYKAPPRKVDRELEPFVLHIPQFQRDIAVIITPHRE